MFQHTTRLTGWGLLGVTLGAVVAYGIAEDAAPAAKPSQFAPLMDVKAQVDIYVKDLAADLAEAADYDPDRQNRVFLNANTLIVLGQTLVVHDEEDDFKKAAPAIIRSASSLAAEAEEFAGAKAALGEVELAVASREGGATRLDAVADLQALMKQVPIVNNHLRRGVTGKRFDRMVDHNAGHAATLAAIAQSSMYCTDYCADDEDKAKWAKICADLRDAAAEVQVAVRRKDLAAATDGLGKIVKTCDQCHEAFRN